MFAFTYKYDGDALYIVYYSVCLTLCLPFCALLLLTNILVWLGKSNRQFSLLHEREKGRGKARSKQACVKCLLLASPDLLLHRHLSKLNLAKWIPNIITHHVVRNACLAVHVWYNLWLVSPPRAVIKCVGMSDLL